ncbi:polysaccharide biosynthesis tyrosine autokinase [Chrysosporum bergii ANA360D]|uniref:non-specific protein-tyrosine kinase n=1 Tax=Chrysosporum bergii ANA360D TaxID=617107 RepID=A0AA43GR32_9CYAN|nr:polysaccharide biosynthesis tyrosine autokinase [Chrysosporum bergii]MDH6060040.1 polysaccharide biosynthesis tyrosine autokinase [Chrysosporum bergii ANA360D]
MLCVCVVASCNTYYITIRLNNPNQIIDMEEYLQLWIILRRRWLPVSIVFFTLVVLSIVKTIVETPTYRASGQLVLKKNPTSSLTGVGRQLGALESSVTGRPIATEAAILSSLPLAEKTINALKLNMNPLVFLKDLEVSNIENTDILQVYYTSIDPRLAAKVVNSLMDVYIENDISANRAQTKSARDFIAQELPKRRAALQFAEKRLQNFKQQNQVLDLKTEAGSIVSTITDLNRQIEATQSELRVQKARIESIQQLFGITPQQAVIAGFVAESPSVVPVMQKLQETQIRLETLRLELTDSHPTIINLKEQEIVLKQDLESRIQTSFLGQVGRLNEINQAKDVVQLNGPGLQQNLLSSYANAEAERLTFQVRLTALGEVIQSYRQRADSLPQLELQQRELEREINATEFSYQELLAKNQELEIAENMQISNARVITPALIPAVPLRSRQYINLLQGVLGGFVVGGATAFILEKMDKTIKTSQSAQELLPYNLLAYIPFFTSSGKEAPDVVVRNEPESSVSESFRILQTNLRYFNSEKSTKVIVVSSAVPKEGKSTVAANLAFSMSQIGARVLLVDGDLRNPSQYKIWEVDNELGLSHVIRDQLSLESTVKEISPNFQLLTAGERINNPNTLIVSSQMAAFVAQAARTYDFVVIDTPPLIAAADATILGKLANGILFVIRPGIADVNSVAIVKDLLEKAEQNVLGIAMNGISAQQRYYDYYYYASSKV